MKVLIKAVVIYYASWIYSVEKHFAIQWKSKSSSDTTPAIKKFFSTSGLHEFNSKPLVIIMSDSDSAFKGNDRQEE